MTSNQTGRITRRQFIRAAGIGAAGAVAAGLGLGRVAHALPWPAGNDNPDPVHIISDNSGGWVVYPTGDGTILGENPYATGTILTVDSRNVQWAVANVDPSIVPLPQVLLKSRTKETNEPMYFNFLLDPAPLHDFIPFDPNAPEPSLPMVQSASVAVFRDVAIIGESMPAYNKSFPGFGAPPEVLPDRTMIFGGYASFYNSPENATPASKVTVRNIYFAYPSNAAVRVKNCSGFEVSDCIIYDVCAADVAFFLIDVSPDPANPFYLYVPFRIAFGIEATGLGLAEPFMKPNPYLFGDCRITNNFIKRRTEENPFMYCFVDCGIVTQYTDMNILVSGNEIHNFPYVGYGMDANTGTATIANNRFFNCGFQGVLYPAVFTFPMIESAGFGVRRNDSPVLIESNYVECGYDYGGNLKTQYGIILTGASGSTVRSNTIVSALSPGDPGVTASGIGLIPFLEDFPAVWYSTGNHILGNDLKGLLAGDSQLVMSALCDGNECKNNDYGAALGRAGAFIGGSGNTFVNENFWGNYPGVTGSPQLPCLWFDYGAAGNTVAALKNGQALQGFDICSQIHFEAGTEPPANTVSGYSRCSVPQAVKDAMAARQAQFTAKEKARCTASRGTWDDATKTCRKLVNPDDLV